MTASNSASNTASTALFSKLLARMQELKDLGGLIGLATWDQETYLPEKAHAARAKQLATLQAIYHERLVAPELGDLLGECAARAELTPDEKAMVRVLGHERDRAVKIPERLVRELAEAQSTALSAWRSAREAKRFEPFRPALARLLALRREQADAYGHDGQRYDALLENYEPGMRVARLAPVLRQLKEKLVPMVARLAEAPEKFPDPFAGRQFDVEAQWQLTLDVLRRMGFDFEAGRQDKSIHPFTGGTHPFDVRLTNRLDPTNPLPALYGAIHEGGHGLYEQGFSEVHHRTPLASSPSMGLHESQSRLWENIVGRGLPFWRFFHPVMQKAFPEALGSVSLEALYFAVNRVRRSLTRVESDEVTYNLHIVLRFELELALLSGELPLEQLPTEWNRRMTELLGVTPANDLEGVLQDIHWAWGELGYFPTYSLGNLYAASLYRAALRDVPGLEAGLEQGRLSPLLEWLREGIHRQGYRLEAEALVQKATGAGLTDVDFVDYLKRKYGALYGVSL